jgi:hypothetical protein
MRQNDFVASKTEYLVAVKVADIILALELLALKALQQFV